jgi:hypothetical protein
MSCGGILLQPCLSRNVLHSSAADKTASDTHVHKLQSMLLIRISRTCRKSTLVVEVPHCEEANEEAPIIMNILNGANGNGAINSSAMSGTG